MKKISVIIPCYNASCYIDRCITSVICQTIGMDELEIICVDDASTDATWEHLQKWEQLYPDHILLLQQKVNRRQGAARNLALQYASADWIAFVDADDWLEYDYFEQLYEPTTKYVCDVVSCGFLRDVSDLKEKSDKKVERAGKVQYISVDTKEKRKMLFRYKSLGPGSWAKIIRKKLLIDKEILFPEDLVYEDHYWVSLLHLYAENVYIIDENLYHYFWNPQSTVLSREQEHHLDQLTVQMMKGKAFAERGFLEEYGEAIEYDLLWYAVTSFLKSIIIFWDEPPFSWFQLGRELIRQQVPDYQRNPYISELSEINKLLLELLYSPVDKDGFLQIARQIKPLLLG